MTPALAPDAARELFARHALVEQDARIDAAFLVRNAGLVRAVEARQGKRRRMDLLASASARAAFYLARLPPEVCSIATWRRYARTASPAQLARFEMREADVLAGDAAAVRDDDFPPTLNVAGRAAPLAYKFAPGAPDDGVTVRVDLTTLAQLNTDALDWLVPGFLEAKCVALVQGLPKALRRQLAPAADRVRGLLPRLLAGYRQGQLTAALSAAVRDGFGVRIATREWRLDALPPHLRMNVAVWDADRRRTRDQGRDVPALRARMHALVERHVLSVVRADFERRGITEFPPEGLPGVVAVAERGVNAAVYPVLVDRGDSVDLLLRARPQPLIAANRAGYTRLALLAQPGTARRLRRDAEENAELAQAYAPIGRVVTLAAALLETSAWHAYFDGRDLPATRQAFDARLAETALAPVFRATLEVTRRILVKARAVRAAAAAMASPALAASRADILAQLDELVGEGFLATTPRARLADIPRYLDGMIHRNEHLRVSGRVARDQAGIAALATWEQRLAALDAAAERVADLRFLLQEFRMATFSQSVGVSGKISAKRLEAAFRAAEEAEKG